VTLPNEWLTAALVGVGRAPRPGGAGLPPALASLRVALDDRPPAELVLLMAGAAALYDDAGQLPARAPAAEWYLPALRVADERPVCFPAAARFLERMLNQQHAELLPELLTLLDAAGQRVADAQLPHALAHGTRIPRFRPLWLPVLGERGRWLAAINPDWRYAAVELDDSRSLRAAWERDPAGRAALALTLRRRDPAAALRLIELTWRGEADAARRELLATLETGLSPADEPFLERALDDRDAQVRHKAVAHLARLPESRLVGRMIAAAGDILALDDGHLTPRFPPALRESLVRDGVTRPAAGPPSANDRSRLLMQTVGVIPPRHWEARFGATPADIVAAAGPGRWPRTLLGALSAATARHPDRRWVEAILAHDGLTERHGPLLAQLTADELEARLAAAVTAEDTAAVVVMLRRWPHPWDEAAARAMIDFLAHEAARPRDTRHSPTLRYLMRAFARACPPALAGHAAAALAGRPATPVWQTTASQFVATLALRSELHGAVL
jgi:hypothetical protein